MKGALLKVHSVWTLTLPLRLSSLLFCFLMRYFLSRELKISFDAQADAMALLVHRTFSFFTSMPQRAPFGQHFLNIQKLLEALCSCILITKEYHFSRKLTLFSL